MKKRKKYAAVLLLSWALGICPAQAEEDLELYARSAVLIMEKRKRSPCPWPAPPRS